MFKQVVGEDGKKYPHVIKYCDGDGMFNGKATLIVGLKSTIVVEASPHSIFTKGQCLKDHIIIDDLSGTVETLQCITFVEYYVDKLNEYIELQKKNVTVLEDFVNIYKE